MDSDNMVLNSSGRNSIIGPNLHIVDLSASKTTKLTERFALQFRAEFFDLFNHANLSLPNVDFNSAAFLDQRNSGRNSRQSAVGGRRAAGGSIRAER